MKNTELGTILTISTAHLHPATRELIERDKGDISEGPSIAVREEGYLVNTQLGSDALVLSHMDGMFPALITRFPDLVLIQALGRGLGATWVNIDIDGPKMNDVLPSYSDDGFVTFPENPAWSEAMSIGAGGIVVTKRDSLEAIEAGQTPGSAHTMEI